MDDLRPTINEDNMVESVFTYHPTTDVHEVRVTYQGKTALAVSFTTLALSRLPEEVWRWGKNVPLRPEMYDTFPKKFCDKIQEKFAEFLWPQYIEQVQARIARQKERAKERKSWRLD